MVFRRNDDDDHGFDQFSFVDLLFSPYRVVVQFLGEFFDGDDSFTVERSFFERTLQLLFFPFRLLWGFLAFIVSTWSTSRDGFAFAKSLPVLIVLATFGVALLFADLISTEGRRIARNRGYIMHHAGRGAPQYCEMFARKLVAIKATDENLYQLGLSYHRNKEKTKAYDVMRSLAPDDSPRYSLAHAWMSQYYATNQELRISEVERDELVQRHLEYAIQADPENQMARYSMALFFLDESKKSPKGSPEYRTAIESAVKEFTEVVNAKVNGISRFQLVSIPKLIELKIELTKDKRKLRTQLAQEIIRLQPLADLYPDELDIRVAMVRCATLMEDYQGALKMVQEGYQHASKDDVKRKIVGLSSMVYLDNANRFEDMTNYEQFRNRVHTLCEAVKANPTEKVVYLNLLEFIANDPNPKRPGILNPDWLNDSINGAKAPAVIHCLLGLKEISSGNVLTGEGHWRMAERQFPNAKIVINNMMDVAATEKPEQFDNLLDMISLGITMFEDQPLFYRTRGIYLASLGRYEEAIPDLKFAAEKLPGLLDMHKHLIICYERLNLQNLADDQKFELEGKLNNLNDSERKRMEQIISKVTF